ncbi:glutathione S-transferase [Epibacterium sp. SM1979]|uniref:Glutathione S-transferase n=1 Tax=Tritonibacter litoralis TaxID=2662264 RepID=A0A843YEM5_9RHOB|nr:glutathione S-transferase [Tritonibacter litoralis]MQQ08308.1 glutathione S-transferase [Tritonibacter litoralis]
MRLYYASASPYVRKVNVVLQETGQMEEVERVTVMTTPLNPAEVLQAANPISKIPALERPDGPTLYDSRVICEFLNERAAASLYARGWESKILEATGDAISDAAVLMSYEKRMRPEEKVWDGWLGAQSAKILDVSAALTARWMSHLQGPLDIGQIAVGCALDYVDFRHPEVDWRSGNDQLAAWHAQFLEKPSMAATKPA